MTTEFAGMTRTKCPEACTAERCVISTVGRCKHPLMGGEGGCGPVTLANRARALAYLGIFPSENKTERVA
jgi:hypothetical protein